MIMKPVLTFYLYEKRNQQAKQKLINVIAKMHRKYPKYTRSTKDIIKDHDLPNVFQLLYLQRWTKVAEIDNGGTNKKNYREEAIVYHRKSDAIKTVSQAVKHYEHLRNAIFINSNTFQNLSAKTLFDIVLERNKNHSLGRHTKLAVDNTAYEKLPPTFISDYEANKVTDEANGFKPVINVVAKNRKTGKPIIDKKTGKPKTVPFKIDRNYPITYVMSDRKSYRIAKEYEQAIGKLPEVKIPKNEAMRTEVMQILVPNFRLITAKVERGCRPIIYSGNFNDVVKMPYNLMFKTSDRKNAPYLNVVEAWTIGFHKVDNRKAFNNIMTGAVANKGDLQNKTLKPYIKVYGHDGLNDIQLYRNRKGEVVTNRRLCRFTQPSSKNKFWIKHILAFDAFFPRNKEPVVDPKTNQVMKSSKVIKIKGNLTPKKAKRIRHRYEKAHKNINY